MKADRDLTKLDQTFRRKLEAVVRDLAGHDIKAFVTEGFRSVERQQWLWAQGRARKGSIVTKCDGIRRKSVHQGGHAADIAFRGAKLYQPGNNPLVWELLDLSAKAHGLSWKGTWNFKDHLHKDHLHIELRVRWDPAQERTPKWLCGGHCLPGRQAVPAR